MINNKTEIGYSYFVSDLCDIVLEIHDTKLFLTRRDLRVMLIDIEDKIQYKNKKENKMDAATLSDLLKTLPKGSSVHGDEDGDLVIENAEGDNIGWIDLTNGYVTLNDMPSENDV